MRSVGTAAAVLCVLTAACAQTRVYSTPDLSQSEPGVKFFQVSRPVLVVKKSDPCGRPIDVEIAYVPDLDRPKYVDLQPGLGSMGYVLELDKGYATKFELTEGTNEIPLLIGTAADAGVAIIAADAALDRLGIRRRND